MIDRGLPEMTPEEYIQAGRIFIGFEVDDDLLPYMVDKYGTDCWVYASDIPHAHRVPESPKHVLGRTDLSDEAKSRILWEGTARLYGLESPLAKGAKV
jgi:predicted TIM-barrel fold metal-dependent hydrolase